MNNVIENLLLKVKKPKTLVVMGLLGIFLIFISTFFTQSGEKKTEKIQKEMSVEEYRTGLEKDIEEIVKSIKLNFK